MNDRKENSMILYDEVYFDITLSGAKADLKKFAKYIKGGALEDIFEEAQEYISYDDNFSDAEDEDECEMFFSNDELGLEIRKFNTEDFLDVFCKETARIEVSGHIYDINDDEYMFKSPKGSISFSSGKGKFNDELDAIARDEDYDDNY